MKIDDFIDAIDGLKNNWEQDGKKRFDVMGEAFMLTMQYMFEVEIPMDGDE